MICRMVAVTPDFLSITRSPLGHRKIFSARSCSRSTAWDSASAGLTSSSDAEQFFDRFARAKPDRVFAQRKCAFGMMVADQRGTNRKMNRIRPDRVSNCQTPRTPREQAAVDAETCRASSCFRSINLNVFGSASKSRRRRRIQIVPNFVAPVV